MVQPSGTSLEHFSGFSIYLNSLVQKDETLYLLAREKESGERRLLVRGLVDGFEGEQLAHTGIWACPLSPQNAFQLRQRLTWLSPQPLGLAPSFGFGDRLGCATPGHVQAARGAALQPVFAQQSVRENARTGRTPQQVLDDAMWGVFQAGWRQPWGADADHLKTLDDLLSFVSAGYTFFTVDPGELVDHAASEAALVELRRKAAQLPWHLLKSSLSDMRQAYQDRTFRLQGLELSFDELTLFCAAVKYGRAIAHVAQMYARLAELMSGQTFDFEVSVDETDTPTTVGEHFFIASELERLGIRFTSLAPRFPGRFEKGVDYLGDLPALRAELSEHVAVMRHFGSYKLSLHSGSDKFSLYPAFAELTGGRVHVKTAGTSYLEALRLLARLEPELFGEILNFARQRYPSDRLSYHVSARIEAVPPAEALSEAELPSLLEQFDARQVLHVTFGSVLGRFGNRLVAALVSHEQAYAEGLQAHFKKHLAPFAPLAG